MLIKIPKMGIFIFFNNLLYKLTNYYLTLKHIEVIIISRGKKMKASFDLTR